MPDEQIAASGTLQAQHEFASSCHKICNEALGVPTEETQRLMSSMPTAALLNIIAPLGNILEQRGLDFLKTNVVPKLILALDTVKTTYGFDLLIARALLNGLKDAPP